MATLVLVPLALVLLLSVVCFALLRSRLRSRATRTSRLGKHCNEDAHVWTSSDSLGPKLQAETSGTRGPVATGKSRPLCLTGDCALHVVVGVIFQRGLEVVHYVTAVPLLMVNQLDRQLFCMTSVDARTARLRADQKNAELLSGHEGDRFPGLSTWSDDEAPEEELSGSSSDGENSDVGEAMRAEDVVPETITAPSPHLFFDGLEFYLAVSQVRERTVRSIVTLGVAKTLTTLREQQQNESIAVIEQQYPDFTCLLTGDQSTSVRQPGETGRRPMDLRTALQLSWHEVTSL
ncbi:unnamed protein product [Hyaloperonospora brassicae]|uniref:RxLR effector candidate protein n=1 Tax=Hyaloperonospora brassicae TaxID=162125 RepID=A0AAV0UG38_HYABA|nr:unnamed protein product [Hyaloperonospora brassicae]